MHAKKDQLNDIQALRAIAVLAVILYHFKVTGFGGGFVGVDVFFVISGYLITGKLIREVTDRRFSFLEFSRSRARRLLPALLTTVAVSFVTGAMIFSPGDFQRQSISTICALLGVSNVGFWMESGYFDAAAMLKPLLHTWSLAVEIQFYLVWPLAVLLLIKRTTVVALMLITLVGFIAAVWVMQIDQTAAFFLTPFRVWEFSIGGLVYAVGARAPRNKTIANGGYLVGAVAVLYSVFSYSDVTPFPGTTALLPVVGTTGMILFGKSDVARHVSNRPAVFIGEISYSAYLVHWPLVVFAQYVLLRDLTWGDQFILVVVTGVLAILLYYTIERPFRRPSSLRIIRPLVYASLMSAVVMPAYSSHADGWTWRIPAEIRTIGSVKLPKMEDYIWAAHRAHRQPSFETSTKPKVLVIGDSMSADFVNMLTTVYGDDEISLRTIEILQFCAAIYVPPENADHFWTVENNFTAKSPNAIDGCKADQERVFSSPLLAAADVVFVANYWHPWALPYLKGTAEHFEKLAPGKVHYIGRKDLLRSSLTFLNEYMRVSGADRYAARFKDPGTGEINRAMKSDFGNRFIDLEAMVCPREDTCAVVDRENRPIFWDKAHLTPYGAEYMGERFAKKYGKLIQPRAAEISSTARASNRL